MWVKSRKNITAWQVLCLCAVQMHEVFFLMCYSSFFAQVSLWINDHNNSCSPAVADQQPVKAALGVFGDEFMQAWRGHPFLSPRGERKGHFLQSHNDQASKREWKAFQNTSIIVENIHTVKTTFNQKE